MKKQGAHTPSPPSFFPEKKCAQSKNTKPQHK